jgi:hypothetical protein
MCALWLVPGCADCGSGGGARGDGEQLDAGGDGDGDGCDDGDSFACEGERARPCSAAAGSAAVDCAMQGKVCDPDDGCVECRPGRSSCEDGRATYCRDDGTLVTFECDPEQGLRCEPGGCEGSCTLDLVEDSYIGCDYYPTMTLNPVWSGFAFAVAVSNASDEAARIVITGPGDYSKVEEVAPRALATFELPWVAELKGGDVECATPPAAGATRLVKNGAYRVRSSHPVTVYQFSPLEYELAPAPQGCPILAECAENSTEMRCLSFSNDASILLPANALTGSYAAASWPSQADGAGFVTITATQDDTQVTLQGVGLFYAGAGISTAGSGTATLSRGDVLQVIAGPMSDPSGTRVRADKPVQVISGHSCAYVPGDDTGTCDHLEEVVLPEDTLGKDYYVPVAKYPDLRDVPQVLRILPLVAGTEVSFDPPIVAGPVRLSDRMPMELVQTGNTLKDVRITSTEPVLVSTLLEGYQAGPEPTQGIGDPSLSIAVPAEQYRREYLFTAPTTYLVNFASIVAPMDASIMLDGEAVDTSGMTPIGASEHGVVHVMLSAESAVHTLSADVEVGLSVYGYGAYTSYMYPGGGDLERITIPPPL